MLILDHSATTYSALDVTHVEGAGGATDQVFNFEQGQWYRNFAEIHPGVHISRDTVMVSSKTVFGEHTASEQFPHNGMQLHRHLTYQ